MSLWIVTVLSSVLSNINEVCHVVLTVCQPDWLLGSAVVLSLRSPKSLKSPVLLLYRESERVLIEKICPCHFPCQVLRKKQNMFCRDFC